MMRFQYYVELHQIIKKSYVFFSVCRTASSVCQHCFVCPMKEGVKIVRNNFQALPALVSACNLDKAGEQLAI